MMMTKETDPKKLFNDNIKKIDKKDLNTKGKEIYNFQKISAVLADYGFCTIKLQNDWQGADFIAQHVNDSNKFIKIQLKGEGRPCFNKKYAGKDVWLAFPRGEDWYLFPHDETKKLLEESGCIGEQALKDYEGAIKDGKLCDISIQVGKNPENNKIGKILEQFKLKAGLDG